MSGKEDKTYKIVRLESENLKRLVAVAIEPSGNVIEVTGRNGAGKSSLLDSVVYALTGTTAIPSTPIRKGEDKARITLDLGTLVITRRFTSQEDGGYTTSLIVESEEGARYQSPQKILDALVGALTMDPLEFTRKKPKEQFEALKRFVPDFDFDAMARENDEDFRMRTDVNRRLKEVKAQATGIVVPDTTPDEPIDESALVEELQKAGDHNADIERRKANREAVQRQIDAMEAENKRRDDRILELERQIDAIKEEAHQTHLKIQAEKTRLLNAPDLPDPIDPSAIRAKIEEARAVNVQVSRKAERQTLLKLAEKLESDSNTLTKRMDDRNGEKQKAIAAAKMPVDGIGFGDGVVTLNGLPFDQASSAEQLRASIALAMAANPKLRIILVRDGALLDDDSMKIIAEMADQHQVQVWVETVDSGRPGAVVIEDGMVRTEAPAIAAE